jgi:hypothetical protein
LTDEDAEKTEDEDDVTVESEVSTGIADWPEWQPAMVTGRKLKD